MTRLAAVAAIIRGFLCVPAFSRNPSFTHQAPWSLHDPKRPNSNRQLPKLVDLSFQSFDDKRLWAPVPGSKAANCFIDVPAKTQGCLTACASSEAHRCTPHGPR